MMDLNSVLLEGIVQTVKPKRDQSGHWVEIRNRRERCHDSTTHRFRVEIGSKMPPELFTVGHRIRIVGSLRRESRLGPYVRAEHIETRGPMEVQG